MNYESVERRIFIEFFCTTFCKALQNVVHLIFPVADFCKEKERWVFRSHMRQVRDYLPALTLVELGGVVVTPAPHAKGTLHALHEFPQLHFRINLALRRVVRLRQGIVGSLGFH